MSSGLAALSTAPAAAKSSQRRALAIASGSDTGDRRIRSCSESAHSMVALHSTTRRARCFVPKPCRSHVEMSEPGNSSGAHCGRMHDGGGASVARHETEPSGLTYADLALTCAAPNQSERVKPHEHATASVLASVLSHGYAPVPSRRRGSAMPSHRRKDLATPPRK